MTTPLTITDVLILAQPPHPAEVVSVGVVLDGNRVAWGLCPGDATTTLEQIVKPALLGQPAKFRSLCACLDTLTEQVQRPARAPEPDPTAGPEPAAISRRAFLTGRLRPAAEPDPVPMVTVKQPLSPAIRFGVSQALWGAMALAAGETPADILAAEFGLARPFAPIPLQLALPPDFDPTALPRSTSITAYGLRLPDGDPEAVLGPDAATLQRRVRALAGQLSARDSDPSVLHLDLRGKLGELMGGDAGKMLGALYGLERAANSLSLRVENPGDNDIESLRELGEYMRMRNMRTELAVEAETLAGVSEYAESGAVGWVRIDPAKLGTLAQTVKAVQICREMGVRALLGGGAGTAFEAATLAAQLVLAARPTALIAADVAQARRFSTEMARALVIPASAGSPDPTGLATRRERKNSI